MVVPRVQVADCQQRLDPFGAGFADADQQPGGERHFGLTRQPDRFQAHLRRLVGRSVMRKAFGTQPFRGAFQHQAHRCRHRPQRGIVGRIHQPGIEMRQQGGFTQDQRCCRRDIVQRAGIPARRQPFACRTIARLGPVAEREQRLAAPCGLPRTGDRQHLFKVKKCRRHFAGTLRKGAVMAHIAAQFCQRDKHFARISDNRAMPGQRQRFGLCHQQRQRARFKPCEPFGCFVGMPPRVVCHCRFLIRRGSDGDPVAALEIENGARFIRRGDHQAQPFDDLARGRDLFGIGLRQPSRPGPE